MKLSVNGKLHLAARFAFAAGASCMAALPAQVLAQDAAPSEEAVELDKVEITGSRLRRVDTETASPVFTIDRGTIESAGVTSLGELVQEIPSISGAASNPAVNNGGGDGGAYVSLRGLGSERTLVLLDGRRLGPSFDINSIPINMIERVEVLKEGAGAIYGSDAVGGVVNFITRKDFTGTEFSYYTGKSSENDGDTEAVDLTFGLTGDKGHIMVGMNYNQMEGISAADREFSKNALYLYNYYGAIVLGSSRTPMGRISLPSQELIDLYDGCSSVTRIEGAAGSSLDDYRCYTGADSYDYQPFNLILTPQERGSLFATAAYEIADDVEMFADVFHNFTQSGFVIAPLPFDARNDSVVISADSIYNPFGSSFGAAGDAVYPQFLTRLVTNGNRQSEVETTMDQVTVGARGGLFGTSWRWDAAMTYQRYAQLNSVKGYVLQSSLQNAVGPSFLAADGTPTCGTPDSVIAGCTPINLFNLDDPATIAALDEITVGYDNRFTQTTKIYEALVNGDVFTYSQGTISAAFGLSAREEDLVQDVDGLTEAAAPGFQSCSLSGETCSGDTAGDDSLWEVSAEVFVPLLTNAPFAQSLNLILGTRYSDYDSFGDTTNSSAKLEWRPVGDLLVRASYAEVFRAPTIFDRFAAPATTAALFSDPCEGLTAAQVAANPNYALACENVPTDGSFQQENSQTQGLLLSNQDLDPETGDVTTFGVVYDPSWAKGLSVNVDFWLYQIDDAITQADPNVVADQCIATGEAQFCDLISRFPDGQVSAFNLPVANAASFETQGVDVGVKYDLRTGKLGRFRFSVDTSYTDTFEYKLSPQGETTDAAGTFDPTFGNYSRVRATAGLHWIFSDFQAQWTTRYIHGLDVAGSEVANFGEPLHIGSVTYHDVVAGYTFKTNTTLSVGAENVMDKQPPLFYQFVLNANTNVETYDTVGSFYYVQIKQTF